MALAKTHTYEIHTSWTGNRGTGTSSYSGYGREHEITAPGKAQSIAGSSDPSFRGDASRYSPEEMLVAALSACHMLWMLHLCADAGIVVTSYEDNAGGIMRQETDGGGEFVEVLLKPVMTITNSGRTSEAEALHNRAHDLCFIARSVKFPVSIRARTQVVKTL